MKLRFGAARQEQPISCKGRACGHSACRNFQSVTLLSPTSDGPTRLAAAGTRRSCAFLPLVACAALVTSCQPAGVLDPRGPIASAQRLLLLDSTGIMLVVVIPVIIATLAFAWWYRSSNPRAGRDPDEGYEGRIEFVTWSIPALIVILLGGVIWIGSHQLDPRSPIRASVPPLQVEVVALDWKWLFIYPDQGVAAVNELVVPAGVPLQFRLTSATVMNSFFVPQLGSQIYAMGGMTTHLSLLADKPGEYPGLSAMFSGDGFSGMHFTVKATSAQEFESWLEQVRRSGSALDDAAYAALAKPSEYVAPIAYRSVAPRLFERIIEATVSGPKSPDSTSLPLPESGG